MYVYSSEQIKAVEERSEQLGVSRVRLMENAGSAVARIIRDRFPDCESVCVVCGRGNNGGDGFVAARKLSEAGMQVSVVMLGSPRGTTAADMLARLGSDVRVTDFTRSPDAALCEIRSAEVVIDAMYGTGFHGQLPQSEAAVAEEITGSEGRVVSVDIPSGLHSDSGAVGGVCVASDLTVTFISYKPCHLMHPAAEMCGETVIAEIGVPGGAYIESDVETTDSGFVSSKLPVRFGDVNKYSFGRTLIIGGAKGMPGAPVIAARAALKCGTGLVTLAVGESVYPIAASKLDETVFDVLAENERGIISAQNAPELVARALKSDAVLFGCGMGRDGDTEYILRELIKNVRCPLVIDADGINALAANIDVLRESSAPVIVTPHVGEMARLCGVSSDEIRAKRAYYTCRLAVENGIWVVMKGAHTMVCDPQGRISINTSGNAGMATAGSGDMLAGMTVSLLAQGMDVTDAVRCAVFLHGESGDRAAARTSARALTPSDMICELCEVFLKYGQ